METTILQKKSQGYSGFFRFLHTDRLLGELSGSLKTFSLVIISFLITLTGAVIIYTPVVAQSNASCADPANPIVAENCQPGTSDWRVTQRTGDIEGFASVTSISPGEEIEFYVNTDAEEFDLTIYRSGYYGGKGGRLINEAKRLQGQFQPECHFDRQTGLVSCSNWTSSYRLVIPQDWVSGVYLAKLVRPDTSGDNYILFVVRETGYKAEMLVQLSVTTYAAYNFYGNKSLYSSLSWDYCPTVTGAPRAVKVSFDKPNATPLVSQNSYFSSDYPMVFWLEANGYDVSYLTNLDTHNYGLPGGKNLLLDHKAFLSVGHDEYWTLEMRNAVAEARDNGVHLGFFSSNVSYWRIRLEPDPWSGQPERVVVTYKTTESGPEDPSGQPTTTWRDPLGANDPENNLVGIQYIGDNDIHYFPMRVSAEQAQDRIYRYTGLADMHPGSYADIGKHLIGWEWDARADNGSEPAGLTILASTPVYGGVLVDAGRRYDYQPATAQVTRYQDPSGAIVFASGTNQWAWGLAIYEPDRLIQQISANLFADMGLQPATPAAGLVLDSGEIVEVGIQPESFFDPMLSAEMEGFIAAWGVPDFKLAPVEENATPTSRPRITDAVTKLPEISRISASPSFNSTDIFWWTDLPADGQVWVKISPGLVDWSLPGEGIGARPIAAEAAHETPRFDHRVHISGLEPGRTYYYQVASRTPSGGVTIADELSFRTQSGGPFIEQFKALFRPQYRQVRCAYSANPAIYTSLAGIAGITILAIASVLLRRRLIHHSPDRSNHPDI